MDKISLSAVDAHAIYTIFPHPIEITEDHAVFNCACNEKIYRLVGLYHTHEEYMADMADKREVLWFDKKLTIYANDTLELYIAKHDDKKILTEVRKVLNGLGSDAIKRKLLSFVTFNKPKEDTTKTNSTNN